MDMILLIALIGFLAFLIFVCLKFKTEIKGLLSFIWKHLKRIKNVKIQAFTIPIAIIVIVIFFIISSDKFYYIMFLGIFTVGLYMFARYLMDYIYLVSLDWSKDEMTVIALSTRAFNNYKIIDETGKPDYLRVWLKCSSGKIALVDKIDMKEKIIILNPCFSNFDFTKNFKDIDLLMKKKINELYNALAKYEGEFDYRVVERAKEILMENALLSSIVNEKKTEGKVEVKPIETKTNTPVTTEGNKT